MCTVDVNWEIFHPCKDPMKSPLETNETAYLVRPQLRVQTQRRRVFLKQNPHTARPKGDGGRWGVAQECKCRPILNAIASLIEAQRLDLVIALIEEELISQNNLLKSKGEVSFA